MVCLEVGDIVGGRCVLREQGLDAHDHRDDHEREKTAVATGSGRIYGIADEHNTSPSSTT
jgi:hypothetical protein